MERFPFTSVWLGSDTKATSWG